LPSASSHIQSKIISAAAAASQLPNTNPKFPPADVQKPELSTQKKSKPKKKKPLPLLSGALYSHNPPNSHTVLHHYCRNPVIHKPPLFFPGQNQKLKKANQKKNLSQ
jgi:hypothetical protein